ncbi:MAG: amidohydrolase family protein [Candidatus Hydrogenedentes bacterium]|nr:amidohydrolase family protein [Candidatus Hydrogenedentota bacterium]
MRTREHGIVVRGIVLGQTELSDIRIQDGVVVSVSTSDKSRADLGGRKALVAPPLFDIQVNGAGGINLQGKRVKPEDVAKITQRLAECGISHWIPTLITGPINGMEHGCCAIVEAMRDKRVARAVPGIHLEGPFISALDGPRGAHPRPHVRLPDIREFERLLKAADGKIVYVTLAPELPGALPLIEAIVNNGVTASLGHHHASATEINRAVRAGARLSTHLGNGLTPLMHRHQNPVWPQLAEDRLTISLIADLHHLPREVLKAMVRAKGAERVILTSDCVHLAGLEPGRYTLSGLEVELKPDGRVCLPGTGLLAGSTVILLQGLVNAARVAGMRLEEAFASATTIPAKLFGLDYDFGLPQAGKPANLLLFEIDKSKSHWKAMVRAVFINGERCDPI